MQASEHFSPLEYPYLEPLQSRGIHGHAGAAAVPMPDPAREVIELLARATLEGFPHVLRQLKRWEFRNGVVAHCSASFNDRRASRSRTASRTSRSLAAAPRRT